METDEIASLDLSMFKEHDLLNIIMQRSEVLADQHRPNQIVKAWCAGNPDPAKEVIDNLGSTLAGRAAAFVHLEYRELRDLLLGLAPGRIADVGCGYAFFDLFAYQDLRHHIDLIDIEQTTHRHFKFKPEASGYSSLSVAREFLSSNGCKDDKITTTNPRCQGRPIVAEVDLAVSFLSCGFHFPWSEYLEFFHTAVRPDGSIILDLRSSESGTALQQMALLGATSKIADVAGGKGKRIHLRKATRAAGRFAAE